MRNIFNKIKRFVQQKDKKEAEERQSAINKERQIRRDEFLTMFPEGREFTYLGVNMVVVKHKTVWFGGLYSLRIESQMVCHYSKDGEFCRCVFREEDWDSLKKFACKQ